MGRKPTVYLAAGVGDKLAAHASDGQQVAAWLIGVQDTEELTVLNVVATEGADLQEDLGIFLCALRFLTGIAYTYVGSQPAQ